MKTLVIQGKMKDPELLKKIGQFGGDIMQGDLGKMFLSAFADYLKGFEGGSFLSDDEGCFIYLTYWQTQEDIDRIVNSDLARRKLQALNKMLEEPYDLHSYDVTLNVPSHAHV